MEYDTSIILGALLSICAIVTTIGGAVKTLKEAKQPYDELKEKVAQLELANKDMKVEIVDLEKRMKNYVDEVNQENNDSRKRIEEDIRDLKSKIDLQSDNMKLVMRQLIAIGGAIVDPKDECSKDKVREANDSLVEYLIEK